MEPINYLPTQQVNPLQNLVQGLQVGSMLSQLRAQNDAQQLQEQYKTDMSDYWNNPSADKLMQMQVKYPQQAEAFKPLLAQMDKNQLIAEQSTGTQVINAIKSNDIATANKILDQAITSGKDQGINTNVFEQVKNNLGTDPKGALAQAQLILFHSMTPEQQEKWASAQAKMEETRQSQELFPSKKTEQEAKAKTAGFETTIKEAEAKIAPQKVQAEYQKVLEDIKTSQLGRELDKQRVQIAAMNAATAKETNGLKRQELQLQLAQKQQDFLQKVQDRQAEGTSSINFIGNAKNALKEILADPSSLSAATGASSFLTYIPGTKVRSMGGKIDQLTNILAAANKDVLKGPTSDKDIAFLRSISANLDKAQNEDEFKKVLFKVNTILDKNEQVISKQYGIKPSGVDAIGGAKAIPDTPPAGSVRRIK